MFYSKKDVLNAIKEYIEQLKWEQKHTQEETIEIVLGNVIYSLEEITKWGAK